MYMSPGKNLENSFLLEYDLKGNKSIYIQTDQRQKMTVQPRKWPSALQKCFWSTDSSDACKDKCGGCSLPWFVLSQIGTQ